MGEQVKVVRYIITITHFKECITDTYTYSDYKEALDYYVLYRDSYRDCKIRLLAVLKEEFL